MGTAETGKPWAGSIDAPGADRPPTATRGLLRTRILRDQDPHSKMLGWPIYGRNQRAPNATNKRTQN
eukprot:11216938-Lingulodinium_polyedra.AAC.1